MKKIVTTIAGLFIAINAFAYSGGNGTEQNPYLISSKADMEQLASNVNGGQTYAGNYFLLTCNLTGASDTITTLVGNSDSRYFSGIFDGGEHEIAVNRTGIFGNIQNATIKNLGVSGRIIGCSYYERRDPTTLYYHYYAGGICGKALGTISNCYNNAVIDVIVRIGDGYNIYLYAGGICGYVYGNITNCYNTGNISSSSSSSSTSYYSSSYSGGICGYNGNITNCYNTGNISSAASASTPLSSVAYSYSYSSGICGYNGIIINCYNTGNISSSSSSYSSSSYSSSSYSGGICGYNGNITNCYNTGNISSAAASYSSSGGICGQGGIIKNCFVADCQISNTNDAPQARIGRIGGTGNTYTNCYAEVLSTLINGDPTNSQNENSKNGKDINQSDLQNQLWLTSTLLWDFDDIWKVYADEYPQLIRPAVINLILPEIFYGDQIPLDATSDNNAVPIVYTSSDNDIAEISGSLLIAKKAGRVTITASQEASAGFFAGKETVDLTIQKKELTVTANPANIIYGDDLPTAYTCLYDGFVLNDNEDVITRFPALSCNAAPQSNAGKYVITPSGAEAVNYSFKYVTDTLIIHKRDLRVIPKDASRFYGYANPAFELTYDGFVYGNTVADIIAPIASTTAVLASNAGEYPITCSEGSAVNYNFDYETGKLTVNKAPLTVSVNSANRYYGSGNPAFTVIYSGFRNSDSKTSLDVQPQAACEATPTSDARQYPITLSGGSSLNYDFTYLPGTLTVNKVSVTVTAGPAGMVYGDTPPAYTCQYAGFVNGETESVLTQQPVFACSATAQSNVGNYTITPSGAEAQNYTFSYHNGTLVIGKRSLRVIPNDADREYGFANPAFTFTYDGFVNGNTAANLTVRPTAATAANVYSSAGGYDITCTGGSATNYSFVYETGTLTVTRATLTVKANDVSRYYGLENPAFGISCSGFRNGEGQGAFSVPPQIICPVTATSPAGSYPIIVSGGEAVNYEINRVDGTLTINKVPVMVTAQSVSSVYGDDPPAYSCLYYGFVNGETESVLTQQPAFSCSATAQSNAGSYAVTLSGAEAQNYTFTYQSGTLTVQKRTLQAMPDNASREYGLANPAFALSYDGFVNGDDASDINTAPVAHTAANVYSIVGEYDLTCSGGNATNYSFTYGTGMLTVTRAPLDVKANDATREYGVDNPAFTFGYSGFRNADNNASLTTLPQIACGAMVTSPANTYPIIVLGGEAANYELVYEPGTLTVTKAPLIARVNDTVRYYGSDNPVFTFNYSGFRNNDGSASLTTAPQAVCEATATSPVDMYPVTASGGSAANYDFTYMPGTLTVGKATLTIRAQDESRGMGEENPAFTLLYSGFRNDEDESILDRLPDVSCAADRNSPEGLYDIILSGGSDNNYLYQLVNGKLEVTTSQGGNGTDYIPAPHLTVYPSPAKSNLYFKSDGTIEKVEIYSLFGVCVLSADNVYEKLNISGLTDGLYLVRVYINGIPQTKRILVKN
jgi:hypothetical protein